MTKSLLSSSAKPSSPFSAGANKSFHVTWEEGGRVFCRIARQAECDFVGVLAGSPAVEHPAPSIIDRLAHEYELKDELDPAWAARPLQLVRENGRTVLVLEDPGGRPLERQLGRPMKLEQFLRLAINISAALRELHARGIIHKDIKPANILVDSAIEKVWLTGFGIASRLPRERQVPAPAEIIAGTLAYMAPEQTGRMNRSVDSRSDLYALGVSLYELLTGRLPFATTDPIELIHCHIAREPVQPSELESGVPLPLSKVVMKLLAKTAEERYQTAAGVEVDLRKCLTLWESSGRIELFPLGLQDASERLMIPEKLYGRSEEITTLLTAFDRILTHGNSRLVLVSGYSGIGKSSVVNELHKVIVLPRGIFISGKFDQRLRDTPYSTLAQAFKRLIQQLLNGDTGDIERWRAAIEEAIGSQGRLLTDLIPELARLIGPQPTVAVLSPQDAQLRFQTVFQRFIGVFARAEHPLVIFVDDLQWLDPATLTLIEYLLVHPDTRHLLVIGAYRDNEVDSAHPLMLKLEDLRRGGATIDQITLGPLSTDSINQLLSDTFRQAPNQTRPFAELVHKRSNGNPFFVGQFLTSLAEEQLLKFDPRSRSWSWDLEAIAEKRISGDPADLMIGRLRRLVPGAQDALKLLACLGDHASFATLAKLCDQSEETMHASFRDAVHAGAAVAREGSYWFFHDRVQEAAYALIPPERRAELHIQIARLLIAETAQESFAEKIYDLVNQLNLGSALIFDWPEKLRAAELNLIAGRKAKASTAYASASNYLAAGIEILSDEGWRRSYELMLSLHLERAECEILDSSLEQAAGLIEILDIKARSKIDQVESCRLRMLLQLRQGDYTPAIHTALECLRMFDVDIPDSPAPEQMREVYEEMCRTLGERSIQSLVDLPMMDDPEMRSVMKLFSGLGNLAYHVDLDLYQIISCWMVKLSCIYGTSEYSAIGYGAVAIVLGPVFHRFADGEAFARLAVAVAERYGFTAEKAGAHFLMQMAVLWTRPIEDALTCLESSIQAVGETGEMVYACWNHQHRITDLIARGDPLDQVWFESASALDFVRKYKFGQLVILSIQGFVQSLRGRAGGSAPLDEAALEARLLRGGVPIVSCFHFILQLQRQFILGNAEKALEFATRARPILWSVRLNLQSVDYCFYHSLAIAEVFQGSSPERQAVLRDDLVGHLASFQRWAESGPATFAHKYSLVRAEWARVERRDIEAMRLYEQAIHSAAAAGFLQDEAVAREVAARFCRSRGLDRMAEAYLAGARDCYVRWGALVKVAQLDQNHRGGQELPVAPKPTIEARVEQFDLTTVIKMSEAVAGEIVLEKLIETLMIIAIEHAGADRGLLILPQVGQFRIEAEAKSDRDGVRVGLLGTPVRSSVLPVRILEQVIRTHGQIILDDARGRNAFAGDEYIGRKQARSLLCLPLLKQAELVGVLYLENSLASHVFSPARIAVLKLLASQAAIALENARLYRDVAEREAKIRRLVDANIIGIFISDGKGEIIEANDAFLRMVGYNREDLALGRIRWADLIAPERRDLNARVVEEAKGTGIAQPFETEYLRKDGSHVPVLVGAASFEEARNQRVAFVLDLTERKQAEEALRELESEFAHTNRVSMLGELAASLSHEIAQPIASARNNARAAQNFLEMKPPDLSEVVEALASVLANTDRAGEVIDRIREQIKKAPPRKERFDLNAVINEVITLARGTTSRNGVLVETRLADGLPLVQGDRVQLQQVLLNLILNASDAMSSDDVRIRELLISTERDVTGVLVSVRDSGPGIDPAHLDRIFEAFYTTKSGGTGMGLAICRSIIDAHGGKLWVAANEPRGTAFRFTLLDTEGELTSSPARWGS
jgi:PAS domain S-box-containing protein